MEKRTLKDAATELENSFLRALIRKGIELSEDAVCSISDDSITIGITEETEKGRRLIFGSDVEVYLKDEFCKEGRINFGSTGSFNNKDKRAYWRTVHAASVLKNWDVVVEVVEKYCSDYRELKNEKFE